MLLACESCNVFIPRTRRETVFVNHENQTRMQSSRMHTARSLTASRNIRREACVPGPGRACPRKHACLGRGVCAWGEGVCVGGGGVCLGRGVYGMHTPPPVNRMTDRQVYKYYLAATSLRTIMMSSVKKDQLITIKIEKILRFLFF